MPDPDPDPHSYEKSPLPGKVGFVLVRPVGIPKCRVQFGVNVLISQIKDHIVGLTLGSCEAFIH